MECDWKIAAIGSIDKELEYTKLWREMSLGFTGERKKEYQDKIDARLNALKEAKEKIAAIGNVRNVRDAMLSQITTHIRKTIQKRDKASSIQAKSKLAGVEDGLVIASRIVHETMKGIS